MRSIERVGDKGNAIGSGRGARPSQTLDVRERQQLLRLLVKEILVGADALTIRHSIRIPPSAPGSDGPPSPDAGPSEPAMTLGYRLRTRSH